MITKTQLGAPPPSNKPAKPGKPGEPEETVDRQTQQLQKKKDMLEKQIERRQKQQGTYRDQVNKQKELQEKYAARRVLSNFMKTAQPPEPVEDPNKYPRDLFLQIKETLHDMGLKVNMVENQAYVDLGKEKIINGQPHKQYTVELRKDAVIEPDTAKKLGASKYFITLNLPKNQMVATIWGMYTAPAQPVTPEAPEAP